MHVKDLRKGVKLCVHHKICLENVKFNTFCQKKEVLLLFELEKVLPMLSIIVAVFSLFLPEKMSIFPEKQFIVHIPYPNLVYQQTSTCSNTAIETLEKGMKYGQS